MKKPKLGELTEEEFMEMIDFMVSDVENLPADDLLCQGQKEDAAMTEEEAAAAEADREELTANLNADRKATGERLPFA